MWPMAFLGNFGMPELIVVLVIVLLLFGHRLPGVGKALGRSVGEFKTGLKEGQDEGAAAKQDEAKKEETKA